MMRRAKKSTCAQAVLRILQIVLFVFAIPIACLFAGTTGKISGRITDKKTGEGLPSANVVIKGTQWGAASDLDGHFIIINVPPGKYNLFISYIGYATTTIENVQVSVDRTTTQNITLSPEAFNGQEITVVAERPAIEMDRTHTAAIVNSETVELMPVTEVREVIELQSGVVNEGGELHFRGGRGREVAYLIDGVPVQNSYSQGGGSNVAIENSMIQELEVISGTFNAEYGNAQSGIVNIVTKRPASKFSGSLRTYAGDWLSNKSDIFLGIDNFNPLAEKDFQFSLSGPIVSDKLGFFATGRINDWQSVHWYERRYMPVDGWKIEAYKRWFQEHNLEESQSSIGIFIPDSLKTGDYKRGPLSEGYSSSFTTKLSYYPSSQLSFIYQLYGSYNQSEGAGLSRRYQPDEVNTSKSWSTNHFLTMRHFPFENFFYSLTFSYQYNNGDSYYRKDNKIASYPGDSGIQLISSSSNGFSLGSTPGFYTNKNGKNYRKQYLVMGDLNWQVDKYNFVKAGFEINKHKINRYSWGYKPTTVWVNKEWPNRDLIDPVDYEFGDYWNSLVDYWKNWEATFDTTRYVAYADSEYYLWEDYNIEPLEAAVYVQDKVELGEIIINAGFRFDAFKPNERYPVNLRTEAASLGSGSNLNRAKTKYQLSPRIGISFPISDRGAFHAAYGHFFQMPSFQYMYNSPLYALTPIQLEGRVLGNADLKPEKTVAYEIGLQQELTSSIVADITAYYKDFRNLLGIELATTIDAVGYSHYINRDYGNTKGISIEITKKGGFMTGGINYTYAFANGSSSDPNTLYLIQTATRYGGEAVQFSERKILPLDWDQRHTLNLYTNLNQAHNWSIGLIGYAYSGVPYSPSFVEKFDIAEREYRNLANKPFKWNVDLKAKKYLKLGNLNATLFLKVDNLFDHLNQTSVFSSTGRADQIARLPENKEILLEQLKQEGHFTLHEVDVRPEYYTSPRKVQMGLEVFF